MDSQSFRIRILLQKFLRNECDEIEMRELLESLSSPEGVQEAEQEMDERFLMPSGISVPPEISDRILDRLRNYVPLPEKPDDIPPRPKRTGWRYLRFAASVAGVLLTAGLAYFLLNRTNEEVYVTEAGQKHTVILSDGSLVTLNGGSSISFSTNDQKREVRLNGEAYFDVKHVADKPFYVNTSQIEIKVLGTAFNVKSYAEEEAVETTLIRGRVIVKKLNELEKEKEIELIPNEQAVFNKTTLLLSKTSTKTEAETAWRKGKLIFEDESIQNIVTEIGKWYNVNITVDPQSKDCRFNIFIGNETLEEVLQLFEGINSATVTRNGKRIKIEGKLCQ